MHEPEKIIIQTNCNSFDIENYIASLPQPQQTICYALIIEGKTRKTVAAENNMHHSKIIRIARAALSPLGRDYDIANALKRSPPKVTGKVTAPKNVTDGKPIPKRSEIKKRYYRDENHEANHRGSSQKT